MASKEDKQKRKQLLQSFKNQEQASKLAQMPISETALKDLFDYLDAQLQERDCDDKLTLTEAFLKERDLPIDEIKTWLAQHGGHCDCEVLANVEDEF